MKVLRRNIAFLLVMCMVASLVFISSPERALALDEYDTLRDKWGEIVTGGSSYNAADPDIAAKINAIETIAQGYWDTMDTSPTRTRLWSNLGTSSEHVKQTYRRLREMALGYAVKGSVLEGNTQLRDDIVDAMDWMYANRYNLTSSTSGNWWDWEIGSPLAIQDIVVMMYDDFTSAQIDNYMGAVERYSPVVEMTGANRVWKVTVVLLRGILSKDSDLLAAARDGLSNVFNYSTSGDGFYLDGSFIQHSIFSYAGGYGKNLISDIANVIYVLEGSTWTVTNPNKENVYNWVYDSFEPFMYEGAMMDMTRGREISRNAFQDHATGHYVMQALIRIAQFAPVADAERIKAMVKRWMAEDTYSSYYDDATINMIVLGKQLINDINITPRGELIAHKQFHRMDRAVHHRPGFSLGLAMHSTRTGNYEAINSENKKGWHTSDGMTYLYNADHAQYSDDFWPTVDVKRLAGTTVLQNGTVTAGKQNSSNAVGGASLGQYGVVGMRLQPYGQTLDAKKAWFMFDNEIVALGAGISASGGMIAESIVENRKLSSAGNNTFTVNGTAKSTALGWSESMSNVNWAHLAGNVSGAGIGYYFPVSSSLQVIREARTGKWSDLNTYGTFGDPTLHTRNYLNMWFDHGMDPTSASYAYALLPNMTSAQVGSYSSNPEFIVLENSSDAQGVEETTLGIKAIQYWNNAPKTVAGITSDEIAAVVVKETSSELAVSVADPTQANTGSIQITIAQAAGCALESDPTITIQQLSPSIQFAVNVNGAKGKSHLVTFKKSGSCGGGSPIETYEVEDLPFTSSGDTSDVYTTDSAASGGKWRKYNANAVNDYIEHSLSVSTAGTYLVSVRGKNANDRGITQLSVQGANVGEPIDFYKSGSASFVTTPVGTLSFAAGGMKSFRFTVTGKHASSSSYVIPLDSIILERIGDAPITARHEAELAVIANFSGDTSHIHNDSPASGGKFTKLAANAVSDYIAYTMNVAAPGTYRVMVRSKNYTDRGMYQLEIDGVNQGAAQNQYAASESYVTSDLGLVNFTNSGNKVFKFIVTGTTGSGYNLAFDYIELVPE